MHLSRRTAEEVREQPFPSLPDDAILQSVLVLYQWYRPGEDDPQERGPWLSFNRDTEHGAWNQLGMIESAAIDLRHMLSCQGCDDGD